ncbi:amino acid ABC transporter permease [Halobacteriovorax sp. GB3]|uniref:amino acid ABC transporter permease n=1 Tax=Halobacteriovorax sp. GB3 TaxID=2719615 RepID=UPI00236094C4|nr:amino acid ABC transporter permease [Halobacteriovorax sp. GB3]MDD0852781.1 amino acid ABC transporter permease [Halobacteriovorax sp. GB3]
MDDPLSFLEFSTQIVIPRLALGMGITLKLTIVSAFFGMCIGLFLCLCRISNSKALKALTVLYVTIFRGTPLLLQILFIYFALPQVLDITLDSFPAGVLGLSLNCGAYFAEIFRSAIESIPKGQLEAARALGLSYWQGMRRIIIPQTYKRLIPPVVNELAALSKDTSLVSVIALGELLYMTQRLGAKYLRPWEVYFWAAIGYLMIVLALTIVSTYTERRLARRGEI